MHVPINDQLGDNFHENGKLKGGLGGFDRLKIQDILDLFLLWFVCIEDGTRSVCRLFLLPIMLTRFFRKSLEGVDITLLGSIITEL